MQTINLKQYYPFCKEDIFVEVSDEIVEAFLLDKRAEAARDRKMFRYKAFYSLDCNDGIENAAIGWAQPSPEDYLIEKEELAEYEELIRRLYEAISSLPPMQARRVHARYMLGILEIANSRYVPKRLADGTAMLCEVSGAANSMMRRWESVFREYPDILSDAGNRASVGRTIQKLRDYLKNLEDKMEELL